jgi:hypothetical protein
MLQQHRVADTLGSLIGSPRPHPSRAAAPVMGPAKAGRFAATVLADSIEMSMLAANEALVTCLASRAPSKRRRSGRRLFLDVCRVLESIGGEQKICLLLFSLRCLAEVCEGDPMRLICCLLCLGGGAAVAQHRSPVAPVEPDARLLRRWLLTSASEIRPGASPQRAESARELLAVRTARGRLRCCLDGLGPYVSGLLDRDEPGESSNGQMADLGLDGRQSTPPGPSSGLQLTRVGGPSGDGEELYSNGG